MRVISGEARGVKLISPKGLNVRPTTDKIKESMFDIIQFEIPDTVALDLFSGSGALGIEALSRGAREVYFVDKDKKSMHIVINNLKLTGFLHKAKLYTMDAMKALDLLCDVKFDIIFMDPPYSKGFIVPILNHIADKSILKKGGIIVVEHESKDEIGNRYVNTVLFKRKIYGRTTLSFYREIEEE